jgi:hypothetical protein
MGGYFSNKARNPHDRIIYHDPKIYLPYNGSIPECKELTPEYANSCKEFYKK